MKGRRLEGGGPGVGNPLDIPPQIVQGIDIEAIRIVRNSRSRCDSNRAWRCRSTVWIQNNFPVGVEAPCPSSRIFEP
jgi:hypothetical protein